MKLFGSFNGKEFCHPYDTFDVPAGAWFFNNEKGKKLSNTSKFTTTIGIWIFNVLFIRDFGFAPIFGGYINKNIGNKEFNNINQELVYALAEDKIDAHTYVKFLDYTQFIMPFETVLAPTHTENILTFSSVIEKKKNELIKAHKEDIENGNAAAIEAMEKELIEYAKEYLKDDPGLDVYMSGAGGDLGNNFKNIYIMKGAIRDPDPNAKKEFNIATSNYIDGISAEDYPVLANSLAAGPYSRAKKTEIGGYWEKLFVSALQTTMLDGKDTDCGTKRYITVDLTKDNVRIYMYNYIIESNGSLTELTTDNMNKYIGKKVKMRFSIFCQSKTGLCHRCAGNLFYRRGVDNVGLACVEIPSTVKLRSLKAFHNSVVTTSEIDPMKAFSIE